MLSRRKFFRKESLEPTLEVQIDGRTCARGLVKLCGQEIRVRGVDLHIMAGEFPEATLHILPRHADIVVLPKETKLKIENWEWYQTQAVVNEAEKLLWKQGPEFHGWRLYAPEPIDDALSVQRIAADYYSDGKRYGLRTDWLSSRHEPAIITPANVAAAFTALRDEFCELGLRAIWLGRDNKSFRVIGHALYELATEEEGASNRKITDLPDTGREVGDALA